MLLYNQIALQFSFPHLISSNINLVRSKFRNYCHFTEVKTTERSELSYTKDKNRASLVAQLVKNLPAVQETLVRFLGQEDPLEKGQATYSSILGLPWWLRQ